MAWQLVREWEILSTKELTSMVAMTRRQQVVRPIWAAPGTTLAAVTADTAWALAVVVIAATVRVVRTICRLTMCAIAVRCLVTRLETAHAMATLSTTPAKRKASLRIISGVPSSRANSSIKTETEFTKA